MALVYASAYVILYCGSKPVNEPLPDPLQIRKFHVLVSWFVFYFNIYHTKE